jgi:hypothetical protein
VAGAIVYWRAGDRQRSRQLADQVDAGIAEGREVAAAMLKTTDQPSKPFDQR